jgi:hypothetical protein
MKNVFMWTYNKCTILYYRSMHLFCFVYRTKKHIYLWNLTRMQNPSLLLYGISFQKILELQNMFDLLKISGSKAPSQDSNEWTTAPKITFSDKGKSHHSKLLFCKHNIVMFSIMTLDACIDWRNSWQQSLTIHGCTLSQHKTFSRNS